MSKYHHAADQYYDKINNDICSGRYKSALKHIEMTLENPNFNFKNNIYVQDIEECLHELWENKKPAFIFKTYNTILEKENNIIKYLFLHNKGEIFSRLFAYSLENFPEIKTKASLKKAVSFLNDKHPLIAQARQNYENDFVYIIDSGAYNFFEDWGEDKIDEHAEYTWEEILREIEKRI